MDTEHSNERLSIKNLLFTKAIPNYVIPVPINNRKVYSCTDCGDRFLFQSSYDSHVNRKSVKINYMCRHCSQQKVFYNRCNLLLHIRSHAFKTATINVYDLQVEPIPLHVFTSNKIPAVNSASSSSSKAAQQSDPQKNANICFECKVTIASSSGPAYKDRGSHFMEYTNEVYSCPICLFALPTVCGLKAHLRLHFKDPPYFCPECGIHLPNKTIHYPYSHHCEGFKMMRATARLKCPIAECRLFHPNDYKEHMKQNHLKKVYKCPFCVVACFNEPTMQKHLKNHNTDSKGLIFYQCELCPGRLVLQSHIENHLRTHANQLPVFPCWTCGSLFKTVKGLISHHIKKHGPSYEMKNILGSIINVTDIIDENHHKVSDKTKTIYRVVKRCDQCKRSFTYNCKYDEIHILPNECPYKCSSNLQADVAQENPETETNSEITCHLCKVKVSENWNEIKKHYATYHKSFKCLDGEVVLSKIDLVKHKLQTKKINTRRTNRGTIKKKTRGRRRRQSKLFTPIRHMNLVTTAATPSDIASDQYVCNKCNQEYESKPLLEIHLASHRDPFMAYQCMECGQSFVVKPSFSKHLLLVHEITDVESYINTKECFNENALDKKIFENVNDGPLKENQCRICREQFENSEDLEKHFRVHGMAFLMKSTTNKLNSP